MTRNPNAPKPPKSAFQFYIIENKDSITAENSDKSSDEINKIISDRWKGLDNAEKQACIELAAQDRMRYEDEKASYESE